MKEKIKAKIKAINFSKIVFVILCLLLVDSVILTGARLFSIGPLTYRMILVLVGLLCTVPYCIRNITKLFKNPYFISIVVLYCILAVNLVRAIILNQNMAVAIEQLKGYFWLLLFPIILFGVSKQKYVEIFLKIVVIGGTALSVGIISISIIAIYANDWITPIYYFLKDENIGMLYMATEKIPRVLLFGVMAQIFACCFAFYFYLKNTSKKFIYVICIAINLIGILQTYTRGVYLGAFVAAIFIVVFLCIGIREKRKKLFSLLGKSVLFFVVGVMLLSTINTTQVFSYGLFRVTLGTPLESLGKQLIRVESNEEGMLDGEQEDEEDLSDNNNMQTNTNTGIDNDIESNQESANIRAEMNEKLSELISKNPIVGNGLGATIDFRDGRVELVYHDMVSKIGLIGLAVFLLPALIMLYKFLKLTSFVRKQNEEKEKELYVMKVVILGALIGVMVSTYTNPYFLNSLGLFIYCLAMRILTNKNFELEV